MAPPPWVAGGHSVGSALPDRQKLPAEQPEQPSLMPSPVTFECVPGGHGVADDEPTAQYEPTAQSSQLLAPSSFDVLPAPQSLAAVALRESGVGLGGASTTTYTRAAAGACGVESCGWPARAEGASRAIFAAAAQAEVLCAGRTVGHIYGHWQPKGQLYPDGREAARCPRDVLIRVVRARGANFRPTPGEGAGNA